jgi:putative DNA primase/helicase
MTMQTAAPAVVMPGTARTTRFSLSVLTVTKGNASKQLLVGANGQPIKGQGSLAITAGMLEHVQVLGLEGLRTLLTQITPQQALVHGVVKGSAPGYVAPLVTTERLKRAKPGDLAPDTVARSLEYLQYPDDPFLIMLDRDDNADDPTKLQTVEELIALLAPLFPGIERAGRLVTTSTSSGIRAKATQEWLIPPRRFHVYMLAQGNLRRFVDLLKVRLWNADYGYCMLATPHKQTGVAAVLERAAVDLSVFSPERLDYVAGARIAKNTPFYQDRDEPHLVEGTILDLDAFPEVTDEERRAYQDRLTAAKAQLAPERFRMVQATIEKAEPALTPVQVTALVEQRLMHHEEGMLPPDYLLYFFHRTKAVPVGGLDARYDGLRLADPAEPDYRDGTDAIFHWRQGDWLINSFAHGSMRTYRAVPTPPPDPDEADTQDLLQRAVAAGHQQHNGYAPPSHHNARPLIRITTDMTPVVDTMQEAILQLPGGPHLFQRARILTVLARGVTPPKWLDRAPEIPVLKAVGPAYLRELATRAAAWEKYDKRSESWEPALPPTWAIDALLERPGSPFPPLEGIVCAPTLRPDGSLITRPGYDPSTGLYLDLGGLTYPQLRARPTLDDARTSLGTLQEILTDFPFLAPAHFSGAIAALLTIVARYAIRGNTPLFAVRSTTPASGKGLLIDAITIAATGAAASRFPQVVDPDEERKRLFALALAGDVCGHIDNVNRPLGSAALDMALTTRTYSDRILGKSETHTAPWNVVLFASGNNMLFQGDTARRVVPIDLDPAVEKPEERSNFRHAPLLPWVRDQRPQLVVAALTLLRAFFAADCPQAALAPLGSFEEWSTLVRQALVWAGEDDPCEGRKDIAAESDPKIERFQTLLICWHACYHTVKDGVTLKQAVHEALHLGNTTPGAPTNMYDDLRDALGAFDPKYDGKTLRTEALSYVLRSWKGRVLDNKRFVKAGTGADGKLGKWKVELGPFEPRYTGLKQPQ